MPEGDPLRRAVSGARFEPSAATHNAFVDAAKYVQEQGREDSPIAAPRYGPHLIRVENASGGNRQRGECLAIGAPVVQAGTDLMQFWTNHAYQGITPQDPDNAFCILAEPIPANKYGLAYTAGAVPCYVNAPTDEENPGTFCKPKKDAYVLEVGTSGSPIAWRDGGEGLQLAVVQIAAGKSLVEPEVPGCDVIGAPGLYHVTGLTGIENWPVVNCGDCADYNVDPVLLTHTGGGAWDGSEVERTCTWLDLETAPPCTNQNPAPDRAFGLRIVQDQFTPADVTITFYLGLNTAFDTSLASYQGVFPNWDPYSTTVLPSVGTFPSGTCQNQPASVTLQPASQ